MTYTYDEVLNACLQYFDGDDLAAQVMVDKYLLRDSNGNFLEKDPNDSNRRLAREFARIERSKFKNPLTEDEIFALFDHYKYIIPQGSVQYGCGNNERIVSLSNCFVCASPIDSYGGILHTDQHLVQISKRRGGVGIDLSTLRPKGSITKNSSRTSSGIIAWMRRYSNSIREVGQDGRRGALMLTLSCVAKGSLVWTLNGKIPIENLVNTNPLVYCTDTQGNVYIRKADKVWSNGVKETIRIKFDNDEYLVCTPDHKIMLKNGSYKNAIDLNRGDSVCVLTKRLDNKYYRLGVAGSRKIVAEHIVVGEYKYGRYPVVKLNENKGILDDSEEIHHIDENTLNNHPDNLRLLTRKEHRLLHDNFKEYLSKANKVVSDKRRGKSWNEFYGKEKADQIREKKSKALQGKTAWNKGLTGNEYIKHYENGFSNQYSENPNHKVVSIEKWHPVEVFDISVPEFHNFVVNDVFVHNCHHPDILDFITIKNNPLEVTGANISVRLSNEFLHAVENDSEYELRFPVNSTNVIKRISARQVWKTIVHSAWLRAEPGLIFWDNILSWNAIDCYSDEEFNTESCNPCSELPLCRFDSCRLLIQNLFSYVVNPFTSEAYFDFDLFSQHSMIAQRLMDNLIDLELEKINSIIWKIINDPEKEHIKKTELDLWCYIKEKCENGRRTGLGITGEGDMLAALGIKYGSDASIEMVDKVHKIHKLSSFGSSVEMAKELGPFPIWNWEKEKDSAFLLQIKSEDPALYESISKYGRRNIGNLTIAPTGSMSILTQTTSGIEPLFQLQPYKRRKKINPSDKGSRVDFVDKLGDSWTEFDVYHYRVKQWMNITGNTDLKESPWYGCCAEDLDWKQRVKLQAAAQKHIDHAISSTLNLPEDVSEEKVDEIYRTAWKAGCKGITVYRKNCRTGVLIEKKEHSIVKTNAPDRPRKLPCKLFYPRKAGGTKFIVLVGLLGNDPYEVFAWDATHSDIPDHITEGVIERVKNGHYRLLHNDEVVVDNLSALSDPEQEMVNRLCSASLRHGMDIPFLVNQLNKTKGSMYSLAKVLCRVLKNFIPENTPTGEKCPECNSELQYREGCKSCSCGWSRC